MLDPFPISIPNTFYHDKTSPTSSQEPFTLSPAIPDATCRQAGQARTGRSLRRCHPPSVAGLTAPITQRVALWPHPASQPQKLHLGRGCLPYPCLPEEPLKAPSPQQPLGMLHSRLAMPLSSSSSSRSCTKAVHPRRRCQSLRSAYLQTGQIPVIRLLLAQGQETVSTVSRTSHSLGLRARQGWPRGVSKGSTKAAWHR